MRAGVFFSFLFFSFCRLFIHLAEVKWFIHACPSLPFFFFGVFKGRKGGGEFFFLSI